MKKKRSEFGKCVEKVSKSVKNQGKNINKFEKLLVKRRNIENNLQKLDKRKRKKSQKFEKVLEN